MDDWDFVDVHRVVPLKDRRRLHQQQLLYTVFTGVSRGTDHGELLLLALQRSDKGVRAHSPADQETFTQVIPEHRRQLHVVT